jgi:hypothetical protein
MMQLGKVLSGKERGQRDKGTKIIFFLNLKRRMG